MAKLAALPDVNPEPNPELGPEPSPALDSGPALAQRLRSLAWEQAWLAALHEQCTPWLDALQDGAPAWLAQLNRQAAARRLSTAGWGREAPQPLRFVAQAELPAGRAYEAHIAASGAVPTRTNPHDFFNAAIWFAFPQLKAALNARQAAQIAAHGIQTRRGGVRDALTLFDESGLLLACADPALAHALREFDWPTLLVARRSDWGRGCEAALFGHALLEKGLAPYKAMTAHVWIVDVPLAYFGWPEPTRRAYLDTQAAAQVAEWRTPRDFTPLPVLGIPGWWPANAEPAFYADPQVFRARRR